MGSSLFIKASLHEFSRVPLSHATHNIHTSRVDPSHPSRLQRLFLSSCKLRARCVDKGPRQWPPFAIQEGECVDGKYPQGHTKSRLRLTLEYIDVFNSVSINVPS